MRHWVVYDDETTLEIAADHFAFEDAHVKLTRWALVLLRPREVVVRRLPLRGRVSVRGVMTVT